MGNLIVQEWMTLDGVVQAPGAPDEDRTGDFTHGGWHLDYFDEVSRKWVVDNLMDATSYLFGRGTYERFAAHWPKATEEERPIAEPLNTRRKYVASTTLQEPLEWRHASLLQEPLPKSVKTLKKESKGDILVIGSPVLVQTLLHHELVDELRLMIDPLVLGGGKRIFGDDGVRRSFRLTHNQGTSTGALLMTLVPEL